MDSLARGSNRAEKRSTLLLNCYLRHTVYPCCIRAMKARYSWHRLINSDNYDSTLETAYWQFLLWITLLKRIERIECINDMQNFEWKQILDAGRLQSGISGINDPLSAYDSYQKARCYRSNVYFVFQLTWKYKNRFQTYIKNPSTW